MTTERSPSNVQGRTGCGIFALSLDPLGRPHLSTLPRGFQGRTGCQIPELEADSLGRTPSPHPLTPAAGARGPQMGGVGGGATPPPHPPPPPPPAPGGGGPPFWGVGAGGPPPPQHPIFQIPRLHSSGGGVRGGGHPPEQGLHSMREQRCPPLNPAAAGKGSLLLGVGAMLLSGSSTAHASKPVRP